MAHEITAPSADRGEALAYTIKRGTDQQVSLARVIETPYGERGVSITTRGMSMLTELDALNLVDGVLDLLGVRRDKGKLAGARTELRQEITRLQVESRANEAARKLYELWTDQLDGPATPWGDLREQTRARWIAREAAVAELYRGQA